MERRYKHKMQIEFEVDSSSPVIPTNAEIASALYKMRHEEGLVDKVKPIDSEEVPMFRKYVFDEPVEFGGHKLAYGVTIKLPIYDYTPVKMEIHFYNKGTELEYFRTLKKRLFTEKKEKGVRKMYFRHENTTFDLVIDEKDVLGRKTFTFEQKQEVDS
jgi:hypothetical protein